MKKLFFVLGVVGLFAACSSQKQQPLVGADRDEHGCIGSAGYVWSEQYGKCIRPWEQQKEPAATRSNWQFWTEVGII